MARSVSFNGQTLYRPGAYSRFDVDNNAGNPLGSNDVLFLIGESTKGAPGATTGITSWSAASLNALIATYGEGPLIDCAVAASRPSKTAGVGGAGRFLVWKTNASTQASATLTQTAVDQFNILGRAYGDGDNSFSVVVAAGTTANQKLITVTELSGTSEVLGENAAQDILTIQYTGDATTAVAEIAGASRAALTLTTTLAGDQTDGSVNLNFTLANFTIKQLADAINASVGYTATINTANQSAKVANELDITASTTIDGVNLTFRRLQTEVLELLNTSTRIEATEAGVFSGVPDNQTQDLTGGAQGSSTNTNFSTGLSKSLAEVYNVVVPCVSRDASVDIADADLGFTDAGSTYTINSIHAAVSSHLLLRGNTKNRKEAQSFVGFRNAAKATCFNAAATLGDFNIQFVMLDGVFNNNQGNNVVAQPHVIAAMMAGIRLGTAVGEPITYKFLNVSQIGHVLSPTTLLATGDYNEGEDGEDAIINGVTSVERVSGGFRIVVDNTTYGADGSFVFNRGSVVEAGYFVNKDLRDLIDAIIVGTKVSNGQASSIKNIVRNRLRELNAPDVQIITSSDDAPEGFREDTFVVTVNGAVTRVQVEFKPVQGNDFVLFDNTFGDITQTSIA